LAEDDIAGYRVVDSQGLEAVGVVHNFHVVEQAGTTGRKPEPAGRQTNRGREVDLAVDLPGGAEGAHRLAVRQSRPRPK
jgi:hypothetical protein